MNKFLNKLNPNFSLEKKSIRLQLVRDKHRILWILLHMKKKILNVIEYKSFVSIFIQYDKKYNQREDKKNLNLTNF